MKTFSQRTTSRQGIQHGDSVNVSRQSRERMLKAMRVLEAALAKASPGREATWRKAVVTALRALEDASEQQAGELNGKEGLLAELLQEHPRLERGILKLRRQHGDLLDEIRTLQGDFSGTNCDDHSDVADIRQRLARLLDALRHFQSQETDLIYEAIQVDIGVGD